MYIFKAGLVIVLGILTSQQALADTYDPSGIGKIIQAPEIINQNPNKALLRYNQPKLEYFSIAAIAAIVHSDKPGQSLPKHLHHSVSYGIDFASVFLAESMNFAIYKFFESPILSILSSAAFESLPYLMSAIENDSSKTDSDEEDSKFGSSLYIHELTYRAKINTQQKYSLTMANSFNLGEYNLANALVSSSNMFSPLAFVFSELLEKNSVPAIGSNQYLALQYHNSLNKFMIPVAMIASFESVLKYKTLYGYLTNNEENTEMFYLLDMGDLKLTPWLGYKYTHQGFLYTGDLFIKYKSNALKLSIGFNKATKDPANGQIDTYKVESEDSEHPHPELEFTSSIDYTVYIGATLGTVVLPFDLLLDSQVDFYYTVFKNKQSIPSLEALMALSYPIFEKMNAKVALRYTDNMLYKAGLDKENLSDDGATIWQRNKMFENVLNRLNIDFRLEMLI